MTDAIERLALLMSNEHKFTVEFCEVTNSVIFLIEKSAWPQLWPFLKPNCEFDVQKNGMRHFYSVNSKSLEIIGKIVWEGLGLNLVYIQKKQ